MPKRRRDNHINHRRRRPTFKRRRKTTYRKKRRSRALNIPRIFPDKANVTHKYVCQGKIVTSFASPTNSIVFRANSMYDPEYTGIGHQPLLFDNLSILYDHWTVTSSNIKIKLWCDAGSSSDTDPKNVVLQLKDAGTGPMNAFDAREQPGTSYTSIIANSTPYTVSKGFSSKKFFGKASGNVVGETELRGDAANNPSEGAYFVLTVSDLEALNHAETDGQASIHWEAEITYRATWTERKAITQS